MADEILYDYVLGEEVMNQAKATGLDDRVAALEATGSTVNPGYRIDYSNGVINFNPVQPIVNVTGSSVTLVPDTAYKMYAMTGALNVTANPPAANYWGLEGHAEIFVSAVGYVVFDTSKIVLANQLEPDSVNNCTLRFHDGMCYVSVEDHIAGYIVVNGSTSGEGSLAYGIATSTNDYIAFDATTNGSTIDLSGTTASGEKHIVGNGYTETTLTGAVDCGTSKFTVANLSLANVQVTGGTMTLGDVYIPSGSTVAVSGGGLAIEKVTGAGNGSMIDLGDFTHSLKVNAASFAKNCSFQFNVGTFQTAAGGASDLNFEGCSFSKSGTGNYVIYMRNNGTLSIRDCAFPGSRTGIFCAGSSSVRINVGGSNVINRIYTAGENKGDVFISSGAIIDLTGNTNTAPIAPGGGITFASGGATVLYSSGAVSGSYMMDNVTLPAGAKLTNTAVVDLGGGSASVVGGSASGTTLISGNVKLKFGAIFTNVELGTSGNIHVSSGGTLTSMDIQSMSFVAVLDGGVASNTNAQRGYYNILAGGVAYNDVIGSVGKCVISSGGTTNEPTISSGGTLTVLSGGTALQVTSATGATIVVSDGGYITYKE